MKKIIVVAAILAGLGIATGCNGQSQPQGQANFDHILSDMKSDNDRQQLEIDRRKHDNLVAELGEQTAARWEKCTFQPPKNPANQASCKKLLDRVERKRTATKAAHDKAEKSW